MPGPAARPAVEAPLNTPQPETRKKKTAPVETSDATPLIAPMPGMIVGVEKKEGQKVNQGETILVLEAMKMENGLAAPVSGTITKINPGVGDHVAKNDILCLITQ